MIKMAVSPRGNTNTYNAHQDASYLLASIDGPDGLPDTADDSAFAYGDGGRLVATTRNGVTQLLSHNAAGQLTGVSTIIGSGPDTSYRYDPLGQRTGSTDDQGVEHSFLLAPAAQRLGAGPLDVSVQHLATDGSGGVQAGWVYAGENPILRFDASNNVEYYLEDASDSIAALVNSAGAAVAEYAYDGFGNLLDGSDEPVSDAGGDFGFHAAWLDPDTGLYNMRARSYDPQTGRFTSPDPAIPVDQTPETFQPYVFANNNPHLYSDPTGGFTVVEVNVTEAIQSNLRALKGKVVRQAVNYAKDEIREAIGVKLREALQSLVPLNVSKPVNSPGVPEWLDFAVKTLESLKGVLHVAHWLWIEVPIWARDGEPYGDGLNVGQSTRDTLTGIIQAGGYTPPGVAVPDYLIRTGAPTNRSSDPTWIIGDFKLSAQELVTHYVGSAAKQRSQWEAITRHARNYGIRTSVFITWNPATKASLSKLAREGLLEGELVFVVSLRP
ncbi:MAG: RHS repeat-associated core domain-containing protein [Pirellulales bacterium]